MFWLHTLSLRSPGDQAEPSKRGFKGLARLRIRKKIRANHAIPSKWRKNLLHRGVLLSYVVALTLLPISRLGRAYEESCA